MYPFKTLFILAFFTVSNLIAGNFSNTQNQTSGNYKFPAQWKTIEGAIEQELPETALSEVRLLREKAIQQGNLQQEVKATLYEFRIRAEKDPSQLASLFTEAELFSASLNQSPERMLMYLMVCEAYAQYLNMNQYRLNQRSTVESRSVTQYRLNQRSTVESLISNDLRPSNLEEWSKGDLMTKIGQLLQLAFQDTLMLQQRRVTTYDEFIVTDTLQFQSATTLYDLMIAKAIEIEQLSDNRQNTLYWLHQHLNFRRMQPEIFPLVLAELRFVEHQLSLKGYTNVARKKHLQALDSLENLYIKHPEVVEILSEKANLFMNDTYTEGNKRIAYRICEDGIRKFPDYKRIHLLKNTQFTIETKTIHLHTPLYFSSGKPIKLNLRANNISRLKISIYRINSSALDYYQFKEANNSHWGQKPFTDAVLIDSQWVELPYNPDFSEVRKELTFDGKGYGIYEIRAEVPGMKQKTKPSESETGLPGDPQWEEMAIAHFTITDLIAIRRPISTDTLLIVIADPSTGKPQKGVKATLFERKWESTLGYKTEELSSGISLKDGIVLLSGNNFQKRQTPLVQLSRGEDRYYIATFFNNYYPFSERVKDSNQFISLFTDRSIYRPGQILQYKAIVYKSDKNTEEVLKDTLIEVTLFDTNNSKVGSQQLKTNSFGSVSGSFVLPSNSMTGVFTLIAGDTRLRVRVEEYKRPTFEVTVTAADQEYRFGEPVSFSGKATAFAGYPLQQVQVKYTIHRRMMHFFRWLPWFNNEKEMVAEGITSTDSDGSFSLNFVPEKSTRQSHLQFYTYELEADVTALHGESQQGKTSVSVGERSLVLGCQLPDRVEKSTVLKPRFTLQNLNGKEISKLIFYELNYLPDDGKFREREEDMDMLLWKAPAETIETSKQELILNGSIMSSDSLTLKVDRFRSGKYLMRLYTLDSAGDTVKTENKFIIYAADDKKPAVQTYAWIVTENITAEPGSTVEVQFGTSIKNARVLYEVNYGANIVEQKWVRLSNRIKKYKVRFEEHFKDGLTVRFTLIHDGKVFHKKVEIKKPVVKKELKPQLTVFRDMLRPGSLEKWVVIIPERKQKTLLQANELMEAGQRKNKLNTAQLMDSGYLSNKLNTNQLLTPGQRKNKLNTAQLLATGLHHTELLAGMYDASLDKFMSHRWQFSPNFEHVAPTFINWDYWLTLSSEGRWQYQRPFLQGMDYSTAKLEFYSASSALAGNHNRYYRNTKADRLGGVKTMMTGSILDNENITVRGLSPGKILLNDVIVESQDNQSVTIRENFNETAFFYPQLHADTAGNFNISFTLPEILTRWKLKLLAHTPDLYHGQQEYAFVSQKELMVNMNLPRFVRQSDVWELQATVVNLTDQLLNPVVKLQLLDPLTDELIKEISLEEQTLQLNGKGQSKVTWQLPALTGHDLVVCRIEARSGNFSDGEQRYLPVLSDRMLVTESIPFVVQDGKATEVQLQDLRSGAEIRQVSLEFTANPAWTALQALPLLSIPESDNAIDLLGAWYSGAVGLKILQFNPILKKVFGEIAAKGLSDETFLSQLEKNQDLKMMVLKATPWLLEAKGQTNQQYELIRMLEEQLLRTTTGNNLAKLIKLQQPSGGFSWMEGMSENRYITQLITEKLEKMYSESEQKNELLTIISKSISYLDENLAADFEQLKLWNKKYKEQKTISTLQLHYMTLRATFPEQEVPEKVMEAYLYYNDQISRYRHTFPLYEKALAAQYLHGSGQTAHATQLIRSLREQSVTDPLKGMYWPRLRAGWLWNERPLSVHTRILEVITELEGNSSATEKMKLWLLNQKRTTSWDSRLSTLEAVMSLLTIGERWLSNSSEYIFKTGLSTKLLPSALVNKATLDSTRTAGNFETLNAESVLPGSGYFRISLPIGINTLIIEPVMKKTAVNGSTKSTDGDINNETTSPKTKLTESSAVNISEKTTKKEDVRTKKSSIPAWGALYRQTFQRTDQLSTTGKELSVTRTYYLQLQNGKEKKLKNGDEQKATEIISGNNETTGAIISGNSALNKGNEPTIAQLIPGISLKPGDKIVSRLIITADHDFEYVVLRDTKSAALEAVNPLSGYSYQDGLQYYRSSGDQSTNYYFDHLPRGKYILEEVYFITHSGNFSTGAAQIQCLYAPEYSGNSKGGRLIISKIHAKE